MKKKLILILFLCLVYIPIANASTVNKDNVDLRTNIIGKYMFTREVNENYDGVLTTQRIMLASKSIASNRESDMIIYYKDPFGTWRNAISGDEIEAPDNFDISIIDLRNIEENAYTATLLTGREFNAKIKALASNGDATYETVDNKITAIAKANALPELEMTEDNIISVEDSDNVVYAWFIDGTLYYYVKSYTGESKIYLNENANDMFDNLTALTELDLSDFDFSNVTSATNMFANMNTLVRIKTPEVNSDVEIELNKVMLDEGKNIYESLTSETPVKTVLNLGYIVTYSDVDTVLSKEGVLAGGVATKPTDPTKEGHAFVKWQLNGADYDFTTPVTSNITLKVLWQINSYAITFDSDGGSAIASQNKYYHEKVVRPENAPTKKGYTFDDWYQVENGVVANTAYNFDTEVSGDIILKAKWIINEYTVIFNTDGGSAVSEQKVNYLSKATRPEDPTKEHYSFDNWYLVENGVVADDAYDFTSSIEDNTELKAKWIPNKYTVTFDSNGGSEVDAIEVDYLTAFAAPLAPTMTEHAFVSWHLVENGVMNETAYDFATLITGPITLKAKWEINKYAVTFNTDGGSTIATQNVPFEGVATIPETPTKVGHTFASWHLVENGVMNEMAYDFETPVTKAIELKAKWDVNVYAVTFDSNGGSDVDSQNINYLNRANSPIAPTKAGHTFASWHLVENGVTSEIPYDFETPITKNITLKAKWTINKYAITFDTDGGSEVEEMEIEYQDVVPIPEAPTKTEYEFVNWYLVENGVMSDEPYDFETPVTEAITLKAKWEINKYRVTFNSNGGSAVDYQDVDYSSAATIPEAPIKAGHEFVNWYLITNGIMSDEPYDFETPVTENIELKAIWQIKSYSVTFTDNGAFLSSQIVLYQKTATRPTDPVKAGNTFDGWYLITNGVMSDEPYDFATPITDNIILGAKWITE